MERERRRLLSLGCALAAGAIVLATGCPGADDPSGSGSSDAASPEGSPLLVFFVMHVEPAIDVGPGGESEQFQLPRASYDKIKQATLAVADRLERHGMRGNFQIVYRVAADALTYEGAESFIKALADKGHAIAAHSHHWMIMPDAETCQAVCGALCKASPGNQRDCFVGTGGLEDSFEALHQLGIGQVSTLAYRSLTQNDAEGDYGFTRAEHLGVSIQNDNESPGDAFRSRFHDCVEFGHGDNGWSAETGNLLHPWRPAYAAKQPCENDPSGKILYVDQVTGDWTRRAYGGQHTTFTPEAFDELRPLLDGALRHRSERQLNVWGWPQHPTEYRTALTGDVDQGAVDALDDFLADLDVHRDAGRVRYATLDEIHSAYVEWENRR